MRGLNRFGSVLLAAGLAGLGAEALLTAAPVGQLEPWPDAWSGGPVVGGLSGVLLLILAAGLMIGRSRRWAGVGIAGLILLWLAVLQGPLLASRLQSAVGWSHALMTLGVGASGLAVSGVDRAIAPRLFGLCLIGFGVIHWLYVGAIAELIPAWIPLRAQWPWATGAVNIAAGLGLAGGLRRDWAGALAGAMYGAWVVLLHLPAVAAAPADAGAWNFLLITVSLWGGAWLLARPAVADAPA